MSAPVAARPCAWCDGTGRTAYGSHCCGCDGTGAVVVTPAAALVVAA
jgi:DnaJ-class molecular chaperone